MLGALCESWPVTWCGDLTGVSPAVTGEAVAVSSEILWEATGRQFGTCPVTIRPCRKSCWNDFNRLTWWDGSLVGYPYPILSDGVWYNIGCSCFGDCSCNTTSEIMLPDSLNRIVNITIDGVSLPVSGYQVYDGQRLVKVDGEWPLCQDWHAVTGAPGAWSIEASYGRDVTPLGKMANGVLALEIAKMCSGLNCELPARAVSLTTQGVSVAMMDLDSFLEAGLTGLTIPDKFIRTYNPANIQDRAHVIPLDTTPARVQG